MLTECRVGTPYVVSDYAADTHQCSANSAIGKVSNVVTCRSCSVAGVPAADRSFLHFSIGNGVFSLTRRPSLMDSATSLTPRSLFLHDRSSPPPFTIALRHGDYAQKDEEGLHSAL